MNGKTAKAVNAVGICFFILSIVAGIVLLICGLVSDNDATKTMMLCSLPISLLIGCLILLVTIGLNKTIKLEEIMVEQNKEIIRIQTKLK